MTVLPNIRAEQDRILTRCRALHYLIETADDKRQQRAKALLEGDGVLARTVSGNSLTGAVQSSAGGRYAVRVELSQRRGVWLASSDCTCRDAQNHVCKHAIALAAEQVLEYRDRWTELEKAATVIENFSLQEAQCCA